MGPSASWLRSPQPRTSQTLRDQAKRWSWPLITPDGRYAHRDTALEIQPGGPRYSLPACARAWRFLVRILLPVEN